MYQLNKVKFYSIILFVIFIGLTGCKSSNKEDQASKKASSNANEDTVFFPISNYIAGEIRDIWEKNAKITQYVKKGDKTDSSIIKNDTLLLKNNFMAFLEPVIDSVYSTKFFKATEFMDETIGMVTLMFERKNIINHFPDWLGWNVYIKPETGIVEKIYLHKQVDSSHTQQFIWTHDKGCQIRTFEINSSGAPELLEEQRVTW